MLVAVVLMVELCSGGVRVHHADFNHNLSPGKELIEGGMILGKSYGNVEKSIGVEALSYSYLTLLRRLKTNFIPLTYSGF
jgi:hypothetical protein